jgi:hypothetical protein
MTTFNLTCEAVETSLHEYLDETLEPWMRASIEEHLAECAHCSAFARELRNISGEAAALPALLPEREVWPGIAARIGAPVIGSEPVAESAASTPTTEPLVVASEASLPTGERPADTIELPAETIELPVEKNEPPVETKEPLVDTIEPPLLTRESSERTGEPVRLVSEPFSPSATTPVLSIAPAQALPGRRKKTWRREWVGLAAAALVLVTAGTTFLLTVQWLGTSRTQNVASDTGTRARASSMRRAAEPGIRGPAAERERFPRAIALDSSTPNSAQDQLASPLTVSATSAPELTLSPEEEVYDKEINTLQKIVRRQNAELDPSTAAEIDRNLRTLDSASAQIRAALQKDPGTSLLGDQASRALEMKVELLRRVAMLRSST